MDDAKLSLEASEEMAVDSSHDTLPAASKQKLGARPLGPLPAGFLRRCQGKSGFEVALLRSTPTATRTFLRTL